MAFILGTFGRASATVGGGIGCPRRWPRGWTLSVTSPATVTRATLRREAHAPAPRAQARVEDRLRGAPGARDEERAFGARHPGEARRRELGLSRGRRGDLARDDMTNEDLHDATNAGLERACAAAMDAERARREERARERAEREADIASRRRRARDPRCAPRGREREARRRQVLPRPGEAQARRGQQGGGGKDWVQEEKRALREGAGRRSGSVFAHDVTHARTRRPYQVKFSASYESGETPGRAARLGDKTRLAAFESKTHFRPPKSSLRPVTLRPRRRRDHPRGRRNDAILGRGDVKPGRGDVKPGRCGSAVARRDIIFNFATDPSPRGVDPPRATAKRASVSVASARVSGPPRAYPSTPRSARDPRGARRRWPRAPVGEVDRPDALARRRRRSRTPSS